MRDALVVGMNRYRRWIDGGGSWRVFVAGQLLSQLIVVTLILAAYVVVEGWWPGAMLVVVGVSLNVYLGIAQMTQWRWDGAHV